MFNRARPDKEIEGIIGRNKREDRQAEGKKKKRQERGLAEAKQLPPPPAAREQLGKPFKTTVQKGSAGSQMQLSEPRFLAHKGLI